MYYSSKSKHETDPWFLVTLLVVGLCILLYFAKKKLSYFKNLGIPYLPGWPILGNMSGPVFRTKHFTEVVREIYNVSSEAKYVGAFDFNNEVIVVRDPELIKDVTIKHFDHFMDHKSIIDASLDPLFGGSLFNITGEKWREARNLLSPAFTSSKMKGMFELMVACGEDLVAYLADHNKINGKMVETKELFTKYTNDVIATCVFGMKVNSLDDPKNLFYVYGLEATNFAKMTFKFLLARLSPTLLRWLNIRLVRKEIADFFESIVKKTVEMRDEKGISRPDILQLLMDARGREGSKLKLDFTEITAQIFVFFFAGFETTSTQMSLIAHELATNPDVQRKLQHEIDDVLRDTNGKMTYEAINKMLYLDAVFNESIRLHTQVPFIDRICIKSYELPPALPECKPLTIKPGNSIWIPAAGIHKDPRYYDNPDTFNPDRYYEKKVSINDVENLGFGIGPRGCIGNRFAILETKILLFTILSKFNLKPNNKTSKPLQYDKVPSKRLENVNFKNDLRSVFDIVK
ncbi:hypothetical protein QAD02_022434 [Eretmocerus hayati]|uniref:Uncharacterized protein n=1 Tax=Eretmocerus hayati TaxID=131215 RepID=A0ACC2PXW7_9HYME|nr:hypothetical protein QAD02_022434 [Eretmocerus hayati]